MKNGKILFIATIFLVSLLCFSTVSAADDAASDVIVDTNDGILDESINEDVSVSDNDETLSVDMLNVLRAGDGGTYSDLRNEIGSGGNINLAKKSYIYTDGDGDTITITSPGVINGNGAVIDMAGKTRALYIPCSGVTITNLTIKNAYCNGGGGAIYLANGCTVTNCNFTNNTCTIRGGAIGMIWGSIENCNFADNSAHGDGGAIWMNSGSVENCNFTNNSASFAGAISSTQRDSSADTCIFKTSSDTTFNVICFPPTLTVDDFTSVYGSGEKISFDLKTNISKKPVYDGNISISVYFRNNDSWVGNYSCLSGEEWTVDLPIGSYYTIFDTEYAEFEPINRTITINKADSTLTVEEITFDYNSFGSATVSFTGTTGVIASITDHPEANVNINGNTITVSGLDAGTYTLSVTTIADATHNNVTKTATVTVNKATPAITTSAKTFKYEDKTKKYTITLKDNKGKVLKNKKVTLKIKGKTYIATTNDKGVATFKFSKLTKKGTYTAVITYAGDKNYKKVTKKVKVAVKAPAWETIAKGSKNKSMVKKIQQALKNNVYYLSYKGRYLKVDGVYGTCTERSVKEFQKDKGLKVTGKVDYATAKKLKLI